MSSVEHNFVSFIYICTCFKDDPNLQPTAPTAPPMEKMDQITGYDGVTFGDGGLAPPPSYDDAMRQPPPASRPPLSR